MKEIYVHKAVWRVSWRCWSKTALSRVQPTRWTAGSCWFIRQKRRCACCRLYAGVIDRWNACLLEDFSPDEKGLACLLRWKA